MWAGRARDAAAGHGDGLARPPPARPGAHMGLVEPPESWFHLRMHAPSPALRRAAAVLTAGALALGAAGCSGASTPASDPAAALAATAAPEVVVIPEVAAEPEDTSEAAPQPAPPKTVFHVNRAFKGDPQLVLTRVTRRPEGLTLDFVFSNKGNSVLTIKVSPAGDPNAMVVDLPDGRQLAFKSARGISIKPDNDRVEPGGKQRFSVTFDPLPDGVTKFDVYEGAGGRNAQPGQSQFWFFRNVRLE